MGLINERYQDKVAGVLSCYDRVILQGTLAILSYAAGMTKYFDGSGHPHF
jgi:hypothetical protein